MGPKGRTDPSLMKMPPGLALERHGDVAVLRLNRPEKRNALSDEMVLALGEFFRTIPAAIHAVLLVGSGGHFSAGLDLGNVQSDAEAAEGMRHSRMWHEAFRALEKGQVPVIAVLEGAVIGGGLELAAACHIRVADASAYFALPEGQRGLFVGGGASVRVPRLIGVARMMDMMLTGRVYRAEEGHAIGLAQYLVPAGEGLSLGLDLAAKIAANAPLTNFAAMHVLPRIAESDPETGSITESLMAAVSQNSAESKRRIGDFLSKKAAKVKG